MDRLINVFEKCSKNFAISMTAVALLMGSLGYNTHVQAEPGQSGKKIPDFQLTTLDNEDKKVSEKLFKDRITILNVWSTDCGACKDEHVYLVKLIKNNPIALVGVNLMDDRGTAQSFLAKEGNPYEVVIFDDSGKLAKGLGVYGTPQTFIVDHQGLIRFSHLGELTDSVWHDKMQPLIHSLTKEMEMNQTKIKNKVSPDEPQVKKIEGVTTTTTTKSTTIETTKD